MRMLAYPDLFAMDAKYHRSCYSHYISERNIKVAKSKAASFDTQLANKDDAFERLCEELAGTVLSPANAVTSLASIYSQLQELTECEWTIKVKLRDRFAERLSFIAQPGKSDLVCSSHITVGEALRKTVERKRRLMKWQTVNLNRQSTYQTVTKQSYIRLLRFWYNSPLYIRPHISNQYL